MRVDCRWAPMAAAGWLMLGVPGITVGPDVDPKGFREDLRAWDAHEGPSDPIVQALGEQPADQPYCDAPQALQDTLQHDFGERLISSGPVELWGAELSGSWTLLHLVDGGRLCVKASGIGFRADSDPRLYYAAAGLAELH